jgi:hypothetical protein
MLGWEVNVLTTDQGDLRALRILGARAHDMDAALMSPVVLGHCLKAIAVAADLYDRDERVRSMVLKVRATPSAEVRLWGDALPAGLDGAALVRHEPSLAARAFKAHALAAVGIPAAAAASTEAFRKLAPR